MKASYLALFKLSRELDKGNRFANVVRLKEVATGQIHRLSRPWLPFCGYTSWEK